jgi:hypothetical protein
MRYRVCHAYRTGSRTLAPGDVIDLSPEEASWLLRDSPGCIVPVTAEPEPEQQGERDVAAPPADRMVRGRQRRAEERER